MDTRHVFFFVSTHARIMIINYILSVIQSQKCRAERFVELLKNKRMALLSFGWHGKLSGGHDNTTATCSCRCWVNKNNNN